MSYDVSLELDAGGLEPAAIWGPSNYTSNVAPMWRKAGADLAEMDRRLAADCAPLLRDAVACIEKDPAPFAAMNPTNGWGDWQGCLSFLQQLADACDRYPKATVRVNW